MATYTSNYAWTKPGGNDQVDISVLNGNLDSQDAIMHKAFTNMAQAFSAASTYAVGDIVLYDNVLYKCHTAVTVAGAWTGSTNWQVYKLSEGGGGGTSNYNDLTNKPSINGVTLSGNKTTSDLGIDKTAVGLGNVPNVSTNDQTPTFTEASTRNNIASGEKLSVILGKVQKFFNDLKTVAFSGNASDLNYDNTTSGLSATKVQGAVDELAESYPADNVMMSDGVTSVEDRLDDMQVYETLTKADLIDESTKNAAITLTKFSIEKIKGLPIGRLIIDFSSTANISGSGANLGTLKSDVFAGIRPIANCINTSDGTPGGTIFVNSHSSGYPVIVYVITANKTYHVDLFVLLNS